MSSFRRRETFRGHQGGTQGPAKFKLSSLMFAVVRQERQLIQAFLQLRCRFRHRRAAGRLPTRLTPEGNGFFNQPGLGIMLCEQLGPRLHQIRGQLFEGSNNPGMELLPRTTQQSIVGSLLNKRMFEQVFG
jgi:hypothetical protein